MDRKQLITSKYVSKYISGPQRTLKHLKKKKMHDPFKYLQLSFLYTTNHKLLVNNLLDRLQNSLKKRFGIMVQVLQCAAKCTLTPLSREQNVNNKGNHLSNHLDHPSNHIINALKTTQNIQAEQNPKLFSIDFYTERHHSHSSENVTFCYGN